MLINNALDGNLSLRAWHINHWSLRNKEFNENSRCLITVNIYVLIKVKSLSNLKHLCGCS